MNNVQRFSSRFLAIILVAAVLLPGCTAVAADGLPQHGRVAKGSGPRRVEVLFLGHASTHHNSAELAPLLAKAVAPEGINITYTEDADDLNPDELALYDAVVIYANHSTGTPEQVGALLAFVAAGGGLIPIHAGGGCFKNSEAYAELVGSRFLSHGTGTFTADILVRDHPVMEGVEPFATWDETYVHERHTRDRTVLMERVDGSGREPWSWVRTHGKGRVFYTAYGHDRRTWTQPMFQRLVRNAILWAVGDEVRARLEAYDIPPIQYSDSSPTVLIPDYVPPPGAEKLQVPLSPEASLKHWQVPPGFELHVFAAEPEIVNPIAMAWDERGRLWVAETVDYPNDKQPEGEGNDLIRILEDTNGDGRADRFTVFADRLSIPTGIVLADGGVIVSQPPNFLFLKDTTGDDRADVRRAIITGWGTRDTHAGPSNLQYGFDNWLWGAVGYSGFNGEVGGKAMRFGAGIYRFRRDGSELEFVAGFTNNTWGLGFSEAFDVFGSTANNEHSVYVAIPNRYYESGTGLQSPGRKKLDGHYALHPVAAHTRQVDSQGGFTSAAGHQLYTARSFPQEYWNRIALVGEATGNLLHRAILERSGSGYRELDGWNLMASTDEWTSPVAAQVGPDGAVWVLDWYAFIKQHNTPWPRPPGGMAWETGKGNSYVTPYRDRNIGRIYRLVWKGAPAHRPMSLSAERPEELVAALRHSNMFWRMTAQRLLVERGRTDVLADLYRIVATPAVDAVGLNSPAVHAIWTLHGLGALNGSNAAAERVVRGALRHPAPGVRKNALMALPKNRETFSAMLQAGSLSDEDSNVRLHAFLALADFPASEEVGRTAFQVGKDTAILKDEWLPTALFLAALEHKEGFLAAYAEEVGALEFARAAGRAYRGELEDAVGLSAPALDDREWATIQVPALWAQTALGHFTGIVWLRRELELPDNAGAAPATLRLGAVRDMDVAYVNGVRVGATDGAPGDARVYEIPQGVLRAGRNVVAVQVTHRRGPAGVTGDPDSVFLAGPDFRVPLPGEWKYRVEVEWEGGRRPDFVPGIPFEQQFLKYYNPVAGAAGARTARRAEGQGGGAPARPEFTVAVSAVPGQLRYDRSVITVRAGQRVAIALDNTDGMPHNIVILARGTDVEEAGRLLNEFVAQPGAAEADFMPPSLPVVAVGPMLNSGQSGTLSFTAPAEPGEYPFICTFPGHWRTMRGVLRVEG